MLAAELIAPSDAELAERRLPKAEEIEHQATEIAGQESIARAEEAARRGAGRSGRWAEKERRRREEAAQQEDASGTFERRQQALEGEGDCIEATGRTGVAGTGNVESCDLDEGRALRFEDEEYRTAVVGLLDSVGE